MLASAFRLGNGPRFRVGPRRFSQAARALDWRLSGSRFPGGKFSVRDTQSYAKVAESVFQIQPKSRRRSMFGNVPRELPQQIALVLLPRFSFLPFTGLIESFRLANRLSGQELYRWTLVSTDGQPVAASNSLELGVSGDLSTAEALGTVIICGGLDVHLIRDKALDGWLRKADRRGAAIGALA